MSKAVSFHLGLNAIDPAHYGDPGVLRGCENDARDMAAIAKAAGYTPTVLLTRKATSMALFATLDQHAKALQSGDAFLLSMSSHGAQVRDLTGEEADGKDETWCLYDRMVLDDEIYAAMCKFREGVNIVVLSDSCHSGTMTRRLRLLTEANIADDFLPNSGAMLTRCFDPILASQCWETHQSLYAAVKYAAGSRTLQDAAAAVLLISGCQDEQLSGDLPTNGVFTGALKTVWANGGYRGDYADFTRKIINAIGSPLQVPNLTVYGRNGDVLKAQRPFQTAVAVGNGASHSRDDAVDRIAGDIFRFELEIPRRALNGASPEDIQRCIEDLCTPVLTETWTQLLQLGQAPARVRGSRGEWSVGCSGSSGGGVSCGGSISGSW